MCFPGPSWVMIAPVSRGKLVNLDVSSLHDVTEPGISKDGPGQAALCWSTARRPKTSNDSNDSNDPNNPYYGSMAPQHVFLRCPSFPAPNAAWARGLRGHSGGY